MKTITILLIVVAIVVGQETQTMRENNTLLWRDSTADAHPNYHQLNRAIQLQYTGSFNFASFDGQTLSYKRFETPEKEVRYSLSLDGRWSETNRDSEDTDFFYDPDSSFEQADETLDARKDISISLGRYTLKHNQTAETVSYFLGWGPFVNGTFGHIISNQKSRTYSGTLRESDATSWGIGMGVKGIVGMEWRVAKPLSITVEYKNSITFKYYESVYDVTTTSDGVVTSITHDKNTTPSTYLSSQSVIGLSFYF
ncbi:hypothetical protein HQ531_09105 [bacterium]|nr:hypothetical protein [bacterium]